MKILDHVTIAMKRPAGPPTPARESFAFVGGAWFETETAHGRLRLYAARTVRHAADAAVALVRCDSLLVALDAWLGQAGGAPLDWRWIAAPGAVTASATHARLHWQPEGDADVPRTTDKPDVACRLEMPWALVRRLPAPPAALAARLHWQEVPMVLAAAQWQIPDEELALLEPGGAVVLPASVEAGWRGRLRALDERAVPGTGVPVDLSNPHAPRRQPATADATPPAATPGEAWCEVRLMLPHALPGDRLAGWFDGELAAGSAAAQASLWHLADGRPARMLATGALMPWADGWALAIEQVGV